ncbi:MAG: preprotein translocase subunit SecG [Selenomonadaceae bacterium]|nr:preprotein translocase subunit SecG [Selenomonadaceae bacterium]
MVLDAIISLALIFAILGQEAKSAGMGGMDGGSDTVFTGQVRGMDAFLARATVVLGVLFALITIIIAKLTS